MRLRGVAFSVFRLGEGTTTPPPAVGGVYVYSSGSSFIAAVAGALADEPLLVLSSRSPTNSVYTGHLRRNRAGTRIGLVGEAGAEEEAEEWGSFDGRVADSVGSADEDWDDEFSIVANEDAVDSRAAVVAVEAASEASSSWLFLISARRCKSGIVKAPA